MHGSAARAAGPAVARDSGIPVTAGKGKAEWRHPAGKPVQVGPAQEVLDDMGRIPSGECSAQGDSEGPLAVMRA